MILSDIERVRRDEKAESIVILIPSWLKRLGFYFVGCCASILVIGTALIDLCAKSRWIGSHIFSSGREKHQMIGKMRKCPEEIASAKICNWLNYLGIPCCELPVYRKMMRNGNSHHFPSFWKTYLSWRLGYRIADRFRLSRLPNL